jgi:hypothetical protein
VPVYDPASATGRMLVFDLDPARATGDDTDAAAAEVTAQAQALGVGEDSCNRWR